VPYTNDKTGRSPALRTYMSADVLDTLPPFAAMDIEGRIAALQSAGFEGIQFNGGSAEEIRRCFIAGMGVAESGRVNTPSEAEEFAIRTTGSGAECATVHLGWGFEDEDYAARLIAGLLEASAKHGVPLYPETHRATLFQDMWRTIGFVEQRPELRFNADYSHWYTGSEMVYGDFEWKLELLAPVIERVGFMHGRIGDPGAMQVEVRGADDRSSFVEHFREMWTRTFRGFLRSAQAGDYLCFTPELLSSNNFYSRTAFNKDGEKVDVADRWEQSLILATIARDCFARATT
jgi:hypothetical protein